MSAYNQDVLYQLKHNVCNLTTACKHYTTYKMLYAVNTPALLSLTPGIYTCNKYTQLIYRFLNNYVVYQPFQCSSLITSTYVGFRCEANGCMTLEEGGENEKESERERKRERERE